MGKYTVFWKVTKVASSQSKELNLMNEQGARGSEDN